MKARRRLAIAGALVALATAPSVHAQAPAAADTTLAGAVATFFADSLLDRLTSGPILWERGGGPLDQAVARALLAHPKFHGPVRGYQRTFWLRIFETAAEGDQARVRLEFGRDNGRSEGITFYIEQWEYAFVRTDAGWRFVRSRFITRMHGGGVRG